MNKLLNANLKRLFANKLFLFGVGFMFVAGLYLPLPQYLSAIKSTLLVPELERAFFSFTLLVALFSSAFCSVFIGTEYSDNTMRNKVCVGHTRTNIYLANLITCALASLVMCLAFMVPCLCVGIPLLGFFIKSTSIIIFTTVTSILLMLALTAIFCLIAMLSRNKTTGVIICIFLIIILIFFGSFLSSSLYQPETIAPLVLTANGLEQQPEQPNPNYIGGSLRQVYLFLLDFTPGGQIGQILSGDAVRFLQMSAYSIIIFIATTSAGLCFFRKKDLN